MSAPFTLLDVILFVIVLLSGILAMLRGFTREVLSILSWVVAFGAAAWAYLNMREQAREFVQPDWLADIVLIAGAFLIVLIIVSFITMRLTDLILDSRVGAIDRTLGFVFGVARGALLVIVAYLFFTWLVPAEQQPDWVQTAQSRPYMDSAREVILSYLPEDPQDLLDQLPGDLGNIGRGGAGAGDGAAGTTDSGVESGTLPAPAPQNTDPDSQSNVVPVDEREAGLVAPAPLGSAS